MKERTNETWRRLSMKVTAFVIIFTMALTSMASLPTEVFAASGQTLSATITPANAKFSATLSGNGNNYVANGTSQNGKTVFNFSVSSGTYQLTISAEGCTSYTVSSFVLGTDSLPSSIVLYQGDINGDGVINAKDNALIASAFGKRKGTEGYNAIADFNNDNIINVKDKAIVSENYTKRSIVVPSVAEFFDIGEDVTQDLSFTHKDATPTYESYEQEISNIASINSNSVPYATCDDNGVPNYIDGKYSKKTVKSAAEAIDSLNDIHHIMQFDNAKQEFKEVHSESVDLGKTTKFYRLQQYYHNVPVYGYQLIVSTNSAGEIETLSGHYYPDVNVNTTPSISMEQAKTIIKNSGVTSKLVSRGLCIYIDESNNPNLCWEIMSIYKTYIVSAKNGTILSENNMADNVFGNGINLHGENVSFPVLIDNGVYFLSDELRNIKVYDANIDSAFIDVLSNDGNLSDYLVTEQNNSNDLWSNHADAITSYSTIIKVYDYYSNILGRNGPDDNHQEVCIFVRMCENKHNEVGSACCNASARSYAEADKTAIFIGHSMGMAGSADTLAHEYTHTVSHNVWATILDLPTSAASINEAYSDIIGSLIINGNADHCGVDIIDGGGDPYSKDFSRPVVRKYSDNNDPHDNATLLDNVAYRMDQNWPVSNHANELATLFYKSMFFLSPNSDFLDCRKAVLAASKSMNMSAEKRAVIANAFSDVGIKHEDEENWASAHHIIGVVKDASTNQPIIDAKIIAVATEGVGGGIGYSDASGNYNIKVNRAKYAVHVYADNYRSCTIENVDLSAWTVLNYYMDTVYLAPLAWTGETSNFASGKVINALTGEGLQGVKVKFRKGAGNKTGSYVQTVAGLDVELTTDESGKYYTAALPAGNYTLEASKDGFVTGYINVVSGNSEVCNNQNISLTPKLQTGTIRIVLTWGQDPEDLDSHVEGTLSDGSPFHVYWDEKNSYDGDTNVCSLDVDERSGYGPETITLNTTTQEPYYYYVHHYYGDESIATSGATVEVFQNNISLGTFPAPTDQGNDIYWNVFAIVDGKLELKNTITSSPDVSYAQQGGVGTRSATVRSSNFYGSNRSKTTPKDESPKKKDTSGDEIATKTNESSKEEDTASEEKETVDVPSSSDDVVETDTPTADAEESSGE